MHRDIGGRRERRVGIGCGAADALVPPEVAWTPSAVFFLCTTIFVLLTAALVVLIVLIV
jgi:hypothetical protein